MAYKIEDTPYRFYVYLHRRKDNNEVFYVGKGTGDRAHRKGKRSQYWSRVAAKYGYYVEFIEKDMSEQCAFDLEIETIKFYRDNNHELCNHTDGGDGSSGYKRPQESQDRINTHLRSEKNRLFMKKVVGIPVLCSNGMTFESCKDAEIWMGNRSSSSRVSSCCRKERCHAGGFVWRFLHDSAELQVLVDAGKDAFVEWECQKIIDSALPKTVYCSNGMVFYSGMEATRWMISIGYVKVSNSYISACCTGRKKTLHGFKFSFEDKFRNCFIETKVDILESVPENLVLLLLGTPLEQHRMVREQARVS